MGGVDVSSIVSSIITALGSGIDIFHRLSGKKRKSSARLPKPSEEEEWLRQSLTTRPVQIRNEYDQSVAKHGNRFETGDEMAHSSLAHTLLILNTGLVNLINHTLSGGPGKHVVSRRTLYDLSETAALDTMTALGQLSSRLSLARQLRLPTEAGQHKPVHHRGHHKKHKPSTISRPPPSPLLARGGWVRSKSGSSVVSAAAARKARGLQPEKHGRSKSDSNISRSSNIQIRKDVEKVDNSPTGPGERRKRQSSGEANAQRPPSMLLVPSDLFNQPDTDIQQQPPPPPPKIPLDSDDNRRLRRRGVRPVSTMTFMTTSTKIGEIPESRVQNQVYSDEPKEGRLSAAVHPALEDNHPKKRKGFRFWKRDDKSRDVAVH